MELDGRSVSMTELKVGQDFVVPNEGTAELDRGISISIFVRENRDFDDPSSPMVCRFFVTGTSPNRTELLEEGSTFHIGRKDYLVRSIRSGSGGTIVLRRVK